MPDVTPRVSREPGPDVDAGRSTGTAPSTEDVDTRAVIERRNPIVGALALGLGSSIVVAALIETLAPGMNLGVTTAIVAFGWPFAIGLAVAWLTYWRPRRREARLVVEGGALSLDGTTLIRPGARLRGEAFLDQGLARLVLRAGPLSTLRLEVADGAVARAILASLGLDRRTGTSLFHIEKARPLQALFVLAAVIAFPFALALLASSTLLGVLALALAIGTPLAYRMLGRQEITVGVDGIEVGSVFGRDFFAHTRIRELRPTFPDGHERDSTHEGRLIPWGFDIVLDDGRVCSLDTRSTRFAAGVFKTDPLFEAARAAWTTARRGGADATAHAQILLARGDRTVGAWVASLRQLVVHGGGAYRAASIDDDTLLGVLVDPAAPRELRAGAVIALGAREEIPPRLRVAIDDVADPVIRRIAVACVDEAPSEELEAAIEEIRAASRS